MDQRPESLPSTPGDAWPAALMRDHAFPNFFIIGAYKSGTTSLYGYLRQHPQVFMSPIKETNYFSWPELKKNAAASGGFTKGVEDESAYQALFADATGQPAIGEASPSYLSNPSVAARIHRAAPKARLIAILRHPVDAFYSDHFMRVGRLRDPGASFEARIETVRRLNETDPLAGPKYGAQLQRYYDCFDPAQIRVYLYEDLVRDSAALMRDLFEFLRVDADFRPNLHTHRNRGSLVRFRSLNDALFKLQKSPLGRIRVLKRPLRKLREANQQPLPPLVPKARAELTELFDSDIALLERLIQRDLSYWRTTAAGGTVDHRVSG